MAYQGAFDGQYHTPLLYTYPKSAKTVENLTTFFKGESSVLPLYLISETKSRTDGTDEIDGIFGTVGIIKTKDQLE